MASSDAAAELSLIVAAREHAAVDPGHFSPRTHVEHWRGLSVAAIDGLYEGGQVSCRVWQGGAVHAESKQMRK